MPLPLLPLAIGAGVFSLGLFSGSQIDDAIEAPSVTDPKSFPEGFQNGGEIFSFTNIIKFGLLAGGVWLATKAIRKL